MPYSTRHKPDLELLVKYRSLLNWASDGVKKYEIANSGPAFASQMISSLIGHATKLGGSDENEPKLRMYASNFSGIVSNQPLSDYLSNLAAYLRSGGKIQAMIDTIPSPTSGAFEILKRYAEKGNQVDLRYAPVELKMDLYEEYEFETHFTVAGHAAYRREFDSLDFLAFGNFNDPEKAQELIAFFDKYFPVAEPAL
jgi:hypothetical protein